MAVPVPNTTKVQFSDMCKAIIAPSWTVLRCSTLPPASTATRLVSSGAAVMAVPPSHLVVLAGAGQVLPAHREVQAHCRRALPRQGKHHLPGGDRPHDHHLVLGRACRHAVL